MQSIPVRAEASVSAGELRDPLGEDRHRPVRALVHKYPDRVLLLALDHCSVYCRHCTRRRITSGDEGGITREELAEAIRLILKLTHNLVEGAGAVGIAAALKLRDKLQGKRVGVIFSGGNIDTTTLAELLHR